MAVLMGEDAVALIITGAWQIRDDLKHVGFYAE